MLKAKGEKKIRFIEEICLALMKTSHYPIDKASHRKRGEETQKDREEAM